MPSVPNLSLSQIYPPPAGGINLNTCHDPDCGNYGVEAGFAIRSPKGERSETSVPALLSNSAAVGLGSYRLSSNVGKEHRRTSKVFEYEGDPHTWMDRKLMECRHIGAAGDPCSASFEILSNEHLAEEIARLEGMNGAYDGAACGCCGRRYLDAPDEFVMDGVHQRPRPGDDAAARPKAVRVIHKPCRGRPGARFNISLDHERQDRSSDNVRILQALVNGVGLNGIRRMLSGGGGRSCGMSRVYDRIFWLERTLLAFEREQLRRWRERMERSGETVRHHLAHDDIVLSVNGRRARSAGSPSSTARPPPTCAQATCFASTWTSTRRWTPRPSSTRPSSIPSGA